MSRDLPLAGKCIVVTRPEDRARPLTATLLANGARVIEAPAIRIEPPPDPGPLDEALERIASFDFVVFTSANAVDAVLDRYDELHPGRRLPSLRLAAVGAKTAESLLERGYDVDVIPQRFTAEALYHALLEKGAVSGKRFLLPRADLATQALPALLESQGALVDAVVAYRTVPAPEAIREAIALVKAGEVDFVTFTSASTVRSFFAGLGDSSFAGRFATASIGPVTSSALRELGVEPTVEAETSTTEGLVEAIARYVERT